VPDRWRTFHLLGGPVAFGLFAFAAPAFAPYPVRASLGLLVWMAWWWMAEPVHLAVTAFLPLVAPALFGFVAVTAILPAYSEQLVFLLLGANTLASLWRRWGLDRRIALVSLMGIGTDVRRQILAWFIVSAILSSFLPNAVVAGTMMPIVIAMLRFLGIEDLGKSALASALLIAVAWGTSVGGSGTPMGGAQNLLAIQILEQRVLDHEFLFTTWLARLLPLTVLITAASAVFMHFAFTLERDRMEGSREYFTRELHSLGPMSVPERWGLWFFVAAALLACTRQLYASILPGLTPAFAFLTFGVLSFCIRHRREALLEWSFAEKHMVWGLIYLFAGGAALGEILSETGTAEYLADRLVPLASGGGFVAVAVFTFLTIVVTQITSNTAAVAIAVPITISTFQGTGLTQTAFVYIVTAAANYGVMLPSSSAGPAIAAGYGVNLRMMMVWGAGLSAFIFVLLTIAGHLLTILWPGFGVA
jgi:sodium-dependent dicarboxylate transporter 2/3/5